MSIDEETAAKLREMGERFVARCDAGIFGPPPAADEPFLGLSHIPPKEPALTADLMDELKREHQRAREHICVIGTTGTARMWTSDELAEPCVPRQDERAGAMTDPYRSPPAGWKPEPREDKAPSVFARMDALLNEHRRAALEYVTPLAFGLGPQAMKAFYTGLRATLFGPGIFEATERPTWNGIPVAHLIGYTDPNEARLVR